MNNTHMSLVIPFNGEFVNLPAEVYNSPYNIIRAKRLIHMGHFLREHKCYKKLSAVKQKNILLNIEKSCLNYAIHKANKDKILPGWKIKKFLISYKLICARILSNLDLNGIVKNSYLVPAIVSGKIPISSIGGMRSEDLLPELYVESMKRKNISITQKIEINTTNMYKCHRCGQRECKEFNRYNRSLDEGVNKTIRCMVCRNEWNA